jgi:hypothetical protein
MWNADLGYREGIPKNRGIGQQPLAFSASL